jgi:hypothetical protein
MPQEWQNLLDDNGITRAEQEENPDKVSLKSWIDNYQLILYDCRSSPSFNTFRIVMRLKTKKKNFGRRCGMLDLHILLVLLWAPARCLGKVVVVMRVRHPVDQSSLLIL